ncbi:MAG: DUF2924 domain-containing protein [Planctomycetes bacterium]|nr:DUF2924 domain-containing protein [Planctomycetota bacterium]
MKRSRKIPARRSTKRPTKKVATATRAASAPAATTSTPSAGERDPRLPAAGTTRLRPYKGKDVKVVFLADGIEVDGTRFDSLSAAARHVTGAASINGFLFFGLTGRGPAPRAMGATVVVQPKAKKPAAPKIGDGNELATAAGQRAALAAVGITKAPAKEPRS